MQPQDSEAFFDRLTVLAELFDAPFSPMKSALYFEALRDLPLEEAIGAMNAAAKVCTFMPKPAELRKLALGEDEDHAERAWLTLRSAAHTFGAYRSIVTTDPALGETIRAMFGDWPSCCRADFSAEMWSSKRKEFGRIYRMLRGDRLPGVRYLAGTCELENRGRAEWMKYVEIGVIERRGELHTLRGQDAEAYRVVIAGGARDRRQLTGETLAPAVGQ